MNLKTLLCNYFSIEQDLFGDVAYIEGSDQITDDRSLGCQGYTKNGVLKGSLISDSNMMSG